MGKFDEFSLKIQTYVRWLRKFLGHDIWQFNLSELSKAQALFIRDLKVVLDALRNFADEKIGLQSVALSYFCTLAAVPLVAVCFAVTSGFGLENVLRDALYSADISQTVIDTLLTTDDGHCLFFLRGYITVSNSHRCQVTSQFEFRLYYSAQESSDDTHYSPIVI